MCRAARLQCPDQQVQQYYQGHQKDYQVPEEVKVRHILIKVDAGADPKVDAAAKQKAEDLLKQIKGGADFAALAKANSDDPGSKEQGGELGMIQRGVTVPAFEKAAFGLEPGQISDVIKTQFGYHIIKVEEKQTAHLKSLDEVKAQIVATLDSPGGGRPAGKLRAAARHRGSQVRLGENRRSASPAGGDDRLCAQGRGASWTS